MSILVTGGAGYIGSHCVAMLLEQNYDVVIVDNAGHKQSLKGGRLYEGSLLDKAFLKNVFETEKIEAVIHFAAHSLVGESIADPGKYFENNIVGALNLLECMRTYNVNYLIFSSTAATYGEPECVPIVENQRRSPINPYGESKLCIEKICKWFDNAYGIKYCALRYFNVAGAWRDGTIGEDHRPETHLIPNILRYALGKLPSLTIYGNDYPTPDGTCIRDYIHVEDLICGHISALDYLKNGGSSDCFNLGIGKGFSNLEILEAARNVTGLPIPFEFGPRRPGDPASLVASGQKAMDALRWKPKRTAIGDIVASAWKWHRSHPDGYIE